MSNFLRIGLIAIALVFVFSAFSVSETNAQVNQILRQMNSRYKKLKTLRTNIFLETYNSQLNDLERREGTAIYQPLKGRNVLLRVDWKKPEEFLSVVDKQFVLYMPRLHQAFIGSTDKILKNPSVEGSPLAFINMSKEQLKANYSIKYLGAEKLRNGTKTWRLEMTPKKTQKYKSIDIWVDGGGMPVQTKITERNNDTRTVLLSKVKKNVKLKQSKFKINLPKKTKIIKG